MGTGSGRGAIGGPPDDGTPPQDMAVPRVPSWLSSGWLRFAFLAALIGALAWLGRRHFADLERLRDTDPWIVALMVPTFLVTRLLGSELMRRVLAALGHRLGAGELFGLTMARAYSNLLVPRSGFGALGLYLKLKHGIGFARLGSLVLPLLIFEMLVIGLAGLGAVGLWAARSNVAPPLAIVGAFAIVAAAAAIVAAARFELPARWAGPVAAFARRFHEAWHAVARNRALVARAIAVQCVIALLRALRLWLAYRAIGVAPDPLGLGIASLLADVVFALSITPGGLGLREAAIVWAAEVTAVDPAAALNAAILDRIVVTATVIVAAQLAMRSLYRGAKR